MILIVGGGRVGRGTLSQSTASTEILDDEDGTDRHKEMIRPLR